MHSCGIDVSGSDKPAATSGRGVSSVCVALRGDHARGTINVIGAYGSTGTVCYFCRRCG